MIHPMKFLSYSLLLPLLLAGFRQTGEAAEISAKELRDLLNQPGPHPVLIDIRPTRAFKKGSLPGAINIPGQVLLEKKMKFSRGCVLISDGIADKVEPGPLAEKLRGKGVATVDYLKGGIAAWSELPDVSTTTGAGSSEGRSTRTLTYADLLKKTGDVCLVDLRTKKERKLPKGQKCPVAGFCGNQKFTYCPDLKDFHRRNRGKSRKARAGETPLIVLIPGEGKDAQLVLNSLLIEGYRRSAILIGGAAAIATEGTRGLKRSGATTVHHRKKPQAPQPEPNK